MIPTAPTSDSRVTIAPPPPAPVEVRPEDVTTDSAGRVILYARRRDRIVAAYAAPAGASAVAARAILDRNSSTVAASRPPLLPSAPSWQPAATTPAPAALPRPVRAMPSVAALLLVVGLFGCGWLGATLWGQAHAVATYHRAIATRTP